MTTPDMQLGLFGDATPYTPPAPRRTRPARPEQLALFAAGNATPAGQYNGQTSALDLLTTPTGTPAAYRVKGTTDDVTTCELCGRPELRGTVVLATLDADGNDTAEVFYGSHCAARVTGRRARDIRDQAAAADRTMTRARQWADEMDTFYGTAPANRRAALYLRHNLSCPDMATAATRVADLLAEIAAVRAGNLTVTRFAA